MKRMRKLLAAVPHAPVPIFLLLFLLCSHCAWAADVKLLLQKTQTKDATVNEKAPGLFEITTTGDDPYVFCKPERTHYDPNELTVLSFDYFSLKGLDSFQFFFGPPITARQSVLGEAPIPTEGWLPYSVDIGASDTSKHWNKTYSLFRLDFGKKAGKTIQIRNVRLRSASQSERRALHEQAEREKRIADNNARLTDYLAKIFPSKVEAVVVGKSSIQVSGRASGKALWLCESPAWSAIYDAPAPISEHALNSGRFSLDVPRFGKDGRDRIYSRWFVASKTTDGVKRQSHEVYASDLSALPPKDYFDKPSGGIKGIGGIHNDPRLYSDLTELGVHHIRVPVLIHSFLKLKPGKETEPFVSQGKTYYASRSQLNRTDRLLKFADQNDIQVAVVILIPPTQPDPDAQRILVHPDTVSPGTYSMANVTSREGFEAYCAFIELLASRYCRPDRKFGRITRWIVHNEVDAGWVWTNIGKKPSLLYMHDMTRSMRATYNTVRRHSPTAKVYIPLTHNWAKPHIENGFFYSSREMLEHLVDYCRAEGDFEWGIGYHPYPRNLRDPLTTWSAEKSDFSFDTPMITFKNIEVLDAYVNRPEMLYHGKKVRSLILSEQGINSPDYSEESLRNQAAGLAYAWKKIKNIPSIEAFHYHRWIDHEKEGGLNLGLWTVKPGTTTLPDKKKPAYKLFQALETPREDQACHFALDIIGIEDFSEAAYHGKIE